MVAEARYFDAVFLGCLEDGKIVVDLEGFVVDEYFYFFGGEWREGTEQSLNGAQS